MGEHLVFYDGNCGFCDCSVQYLLKIDKQKKFVFAPLQGETAEELLQDLPDQYKDVDSLILIENFRSEDRVFHLQGKAILRISRILGGAWALLGAFWILPGWLVNLPYRLVAKNRHRFGIKKDTCVIPDPSDKERFLP